MPESEIYFSELCRKSTEDQLGGPPSSVKDENAKQVESLSSAATTLTSYEILSGPLFS